MSILIKGMEMPKNCNECPMHFYEGQGICSCRVLSAIEDDEVLKPWKKKRKDCPLIEIPPHGDLIDRDAFLAERRHLYCENCSRRKGMKNGKMKFVYDIGGAPCSACGYGDVLDDIEDAPTIIPAEEGE